MSMGTSRPGKAARAVEAGLFLVALACGAWWASVRVQAHSAQVQADTLVVEDHPAIRTAHTGQLIGRLEIADLHLSVPLLENYDNVTLLRGVGHVPGTATPGGLGNLVLAGHRDTFFRPLRGVKPGMQAQVVAPGGRWRYIIDRTEVVSPNQVEVLDIGDRPEMTLITCFPFEFIGSAPRRFIVHAHLVSVEAN